MSPSAGRPASRRSATLAGRSRPAGAAPAGSLTASMRGAPSMRRGPTAGRSTSLFQSRSPHRPVLSLIHI
eukprot:2121983-Alexandrium_andersonii.AAC.1